MKIGIKDMYAKTWKKYLKQSQRQWDREKGKRVSEDNTKNKRDEKE